MHDTFTIVPEAFIRFIMGNVHVGTSNADVVRDFYQRFLNKGIEKSTRDFRKKVYRYALKCHDANRGLYRDVMAGSHGYTGAKKRKKKVTT